MSNYENFIGNLANQQKNANMQMHLRNNADKVQNIKGEENALEEMSLKVQFGFYTFLNDIVYSLYHINKTNINNGLFNYHYDDKPFSLDYEEDICEAISFVNEKCLNDPLFSEKMNFKEKYSQYLGDCGESLLQDNKFNVDVKAYFVPAATPDSFDNILLNISEQTGDYLLNGNIVFSSNGEINFSELMKKDLKNNVITNANINDFHFDITQLLVTRDYLQEVFKKTELINNSINK